MTALPTIPPEILNYILGLVLELDNASKPPGQPPGHDALKHHNNRSALFNCSLVSRTWRASALPMIWETIDFYCKDIKDYGRMAHTLHDVRSTMPAGHVDGLSLVRRIRMFDDVLAVIPEEPKAMPAVARILQLLHPTQLQTLVLTRCYSCSAPDLSAIPPELFPSITRNLKNLRLEGGANPVHESILQHLPDTLTSLRIMICEENEAQYPPAALSRLALLPNLRNVHLYDVRNLDPIELQRGLQIWGPNLRFLMLNSNPEHLLRDQIVTAVAASCSRLTVLCLVSLTTGPPENTLDIVTEPTLCDLVDGCPALRTILLMNMPTAADRFLARCAAGSRGLRQLYILEAADELTGYGVADVRAWSELEELCIRHKEKETDTKDGKDGKARMEMTFLKAVKDKCTAVPEKWFETPSEFRVEVCPFGDCY